MVRVCFVRNILSSKVAVPFCISQQWMGVTLALQPQKHLVLSVLDCGNSNRCIVVFHCFNLQFPEDILVWYWISFYILIGELHIFFSEVSVKVFYLNQDHFLPLSFKNSSHILDNSLLWDTSFANIFSQPVACLLIPLLAPLLQIINATSYWELTITT